MILFIRHGERGDNVYPKQCSQVSYDPPITKQSIDLIKVTTKDISNVFKAHSINEFKIISSRFLRCLMTATQIKKQLKQNKMKQISPLTIHDEISQYLRPDWYSQYPITNLIYNTSYKDQYFKKSQFQTWKQKNQNPLNFPQNYPNFHNRLTAFKKQLQYPKSNQCLIIVTHGLVVRQMSWQMNQVAEYRDQIKYCGYALYKQSQNKKDILIKAKL